MASTIWDSVSSYLSADAALAALIAPSVDITPVTPAVWFDRAPRHQPMPYVCFWFSDGPGPSYQAPVKTGSLYYEELVMMVACYAEDPTVCSNIGTRLNQLLDFATPAINASESVLSMRRTSAADPIDLEDEPSESGQDVYSSVYSYSVVLGRVF